MGIKTRVIVIGWTALMFALVGIGFARGQEPEQRRRLPIGPIGARLFGAPVAVAPQPAPPPTDDRAALTETVGLLSGLYLYQTYLNIGLLADGKAERLYDEKAARAVLATVVTPLDAVDRQLAKVAAAAQTDADRQAAERLRAVAGLLRRQGQELVAFWDSGQPAAGAKYEATRQEAWRQLTALLGLDKK
ncbi:MAG TPA: hypothetical protein VGF55_10870 [Gemmataceae bacterium]|jgi:hypothetical protein